MSDARHPCELCQHRSRPANVPSRCQNIRSIHYAWQCVAVNACKDGKIVNVEDRRAS